MFYLSQTVFVFLNRIAKTAGNISQKPETGIKATPKTIKIKRAMPIDFAICS